MELALSEEERLVRDSARSLLESRYPPDAAQAVRDDPTGAAFEEVWRRLADAGWVGASVPVARGGGGGSLVDLGLLVQEGGRALVPSIVRESAFVAFVAGAVAPSPEADAVLEALLGGARIAAGSASTLRRVSPGAPLAVDDGPGAATVSGVVPIVPNGAVAQGALVVAEEPGTGPGEPRYLLGVVDLDQGDAVEVVPRHVFGGTPYADLRCRRAAVRVLARSVPLRGDADPSTVPSVAWVRTLDKALLAAETVGVAQAVLDRTVRYVSERDQFGRPIGTFQAVQHQLADAAIDVEGGALATMVALRLLAAGHPARREVALAAAWIGPRAKALTLAAHQLHGGMGYVTESPLYLWSERAKENELAIGSQDENLALLADELAGELADRSADLVRGEQR